MQKVIHNSYVLMALHLNLAPPAKLIQHSRFTLDELKQLEWLPVADGVQLIHNLQRFTLNPDTAFLFGRHLGATSHGAVGYATLSAPTVGEAINTFVKWFHIRCDTYHANIAHQENFVEVVITDTTCDEGFAGFFFRALVTALQSLMQQLLGHIPSRQIVTYLKHAQTEQDRNIQDYLTGNLIFNASEHKLLISHEIWQCKSPLFDHVSFEANLKQCSYLKSLKMADFKDQVSSYIRQQLEFAQAGNIEHATLTLTRLSQHLNLHERTVIRRLRQQDTSFRQLIEQQRQRLAVELLLQAHYQIYEIAEILGYNESANFCRAFTRWYGCSPSVYRRKKDKTSFAET
ncbi:AraC family transcriptional regulator [Alteromonas ponticola]|uniref:AraC family transcriptional regulator n=1 Tax=Alteromonas ponticola TaxID=2720613 RepID=A0ABX1QZP5_9ALTE|nr:AraC family transcriptional regulator [Alteromonas ponticola]NMH59141.1 AraC family transcriptional regulator [Alteromonas ponticola]